MSKLIVFTARAPALIAAVGERASYRFFEFFTANIRNPHTRRAYARAAVEFFDWLEARGVTHITGSPLPQANAYAMIQRRAKSAGITTRVGNHTFRATGVTAYLKNGGTLERAAQMANHASTRTTQLYDRRAEEVTLDEVERVLI
jgi:integrase